MALHGSGGAYYRSNATIPSSVGLHSAYTSHAFVRGASAPSNANYRQPFSFTGSGQNPQTAFSWNHMGGGFDRAHMHRNSGGTYATARYTSVLPTNQWLSVGATYNGATLAAYLDGLAGPSASIGVSSGSDVFIDMLAQLSYAGALGASTNWVDGEIAEYAYWNVALTADEMASLAKGFRADRIRPQSLQFYAPCVRGLQDVRGGLTLIKQAGTDVVSDHPRIF